MPARRRVAETKTQQYVNENIREIDDKNYTQNRDITTDAKSEWDIAKHQLRTSKVARSLSEHMNDSINPPKDPNTNVVDVALKKSYTLKEDKVDTFFQLLDLGRIEGLRLMFSELQQEYSGIMDDFDIPIDNIDLFKSKFDSNRIYQNYCKIKIRIINECTNLFVDDDMESVTIHIGFSSRKDTSIKDGKHKFGFHAIIPGVKITRPMKKVINKRLSTKENMTKIFGKPSTYGVTADISSLHDANCASVPVFFVGNMSKPGSKPYQITHIFKCDIDTDGNINVVPDMDSFNDVGDTGVKAHLCHEFSINWERKNGIITKHEYKEIKEHITEEYGRERLAKQKQINNLVPYVKNGEDPELMSLILIDPDALTIKKLIDALSPERSIRYTDWRIVMLILAKESIACTSDPDRYLPIAIHFSGKSKVHKLKPRFVDEIKVNWERMKQDCRNCQYTIGTLYFYVKEDNIDEYDKIRGDSLENKITETIWSLSSEGHITHNNVARYLHDCTKYIYAYDGNCKKWYEFVMKESGIKGELYKWRVSDNPPMSMDLYISNVLQKYFEYTLKGVDKITKEKAGGDYRDYYEKVLKNFKISCRNLGNNSFKAGVLRECDSLFGANNYGFTSSLDVDKYIMGVGNGVLDLGDPNNPVGRGKCRPRLLTGFHGYKISKFTPTEYKEFDPTDPITKKVIYARRNMFPDDEPDTYEFLEMYDASVLDSGPKECMMVIGVGSGSNGKTGWLEMKKGVLGNSYGITVDPSFILMNKNSTNKDSDKPSTTTMQMMHANSVCFSETSSGDTLNMDVVKRLTGGDSLSARKLFETNNTTFRTHAQYTLGTNNEPNIGGINDHAAWRRLLEIHFGITFVRESDMKYDGYHRVADPTVGADWPTNKEVLSALLSYMVYNYRILRNKYGGKVLRVPKYHIDKRTLEYRNRQDSVNNWLCGALVVKKHMIDDKGNVRDDTEYKHVSEIIGQSLVVVRKLYKEWLETHEPCVIRASNLASVADRAFNSSILGETKGCIIKYNNVSYLNKNYRILGNNELKKDDEVFLCIRNEEEKKDKPAPETPDQFYERLVREWRAQKAMDDMEDELEHKRQLEIEREDTFEQKPYINHNSRNRNLDNHMDIDADTGLTNTVSRKLYVDRERKNDIRDNIEGLHDDEDSENGENSDDDDVYIKDDSVKDKKRRPISIELEDDDVIPARPDNTARDPPEKKPPARGKR